MDEKKMFKISCILFVLGVVGCLVLIFSDYSADQKIFGFIAPFLNAGIPWGWRKTKNWRLPFLMILGPVEIAVMCALRVVLCQFVGAPIFIGMAIKHFTGRSKDEQSQ